jgi:hypothetical protein
MIEPVLSDPPESVLDFLGSLADSLANLGQPVTVVGTGSRLLCSSGTGIGRANIFERVELSDGGVAFRGNVVNPNYGLYEYVRADQGALWLLPMEAPGAWETFCEIELDDTHIALETSEGLFVTAEGDGDGSPLAIDRDVIGEWQRFHYLSPPHELLPEKSREPTLGEQVLTPVKQVPTQVSGIPPNPLGSVQEAQTELQRPRTLRDKILRPFGG